MTYPTTCPRCGQELAPVVQGPESAPWVCRECSMGWWASELTADARATYRHARHDFRPAKPIRLAVEAERLLARQRGTSAVLEHLGLLSPDALAVLAGMRLATEFATAVEAARKGSP